MSASDTVQQFFDGVTDWSMSVLGHNPEHSWEEFAVPSFRDNKWVFFGAVAAYPVVLLLIRLATRFTGTAGSWLKVPMFFWNLGLAAFSICGAYHVFPWVSQLFLTEPLESAICDTSWDFAGSPVGWWVFLFNWSKIPELGDTVFKAMKGSDISFLHWYHHMTVCLYCWHAGVFQTMTAATIGFAGMNLVVHSVMYTYYALVTVGIRIPHAWTITILQMAQMVGGTFLSYKIQVCPTISQNNRLIALVMYASYFLLFFHFFVNRFILGGSRSRSTKGGKSTSGKRKGGRKRKAD